MQHCILIGDATGDNRLSIAVAGKLLEGAARIVVLAGRDQRDAEAVREAIASPDASAAVTAAPLGDPRRLGRALSSRTVALRDARCLLALSSDAEQNLRAAVIARREAPDVPVVMRSFDPSFSDQVERRRFGDDRMPYIERAYSVAHLSAPSFVAAALLDDPRAHQLTMRVGVEYVSVYRLTLPDGGDDGRGMRRRGLVGRTPNEIVSGEGCQILARRSDHGGWACVNGAGDVALAAGEQVLVGGPMTEVLNLALGRTSGHRRSRPRRSEAPPPPVHGAATARRAPMRAHGARALLGARDRVVGARTSTLLIASLFLVMTGITLWLSLGTVPGQVIYQVVGTALGNAGDSSDSGSRAAVAAVGLATGGVMLGLLTSIMSAWLVRERIVEDVRRRANRMKRHVVIVGLDDVGIQVASLLRRIGVRSTVVVPGPEGPVDSLAPDSRVQKLAKHTPVLTGDLGEMLDHAQIDRARAVVACSEDNLVNVQACMRAKRGEDAAGIPVIARIFDDQDAETAAATFRIDHHLAAVDEAAPAFADAALKAGTRSLSDPHDDLRLRGVVWHGERCVPRAEMARWHANGIRLLALMRDRRFQALPVEPQGLACGDLAALAGPEDALMELLHPAAPAPTP
jgi:voltage-gated potassium channel Kch